MSQDAANLATVIGVYLIVPQIFLALVVFLVQNARDRKKSTLDYYESWHKDLKESKSRFREKFGESLEDDRLESIYQDTAIRKELHRIFNSYDRFATGANLGIYCLKTINRLCGLRIIENYETLESYLKFYERKKKREAWGDFKMLYQKIHKIRGNETR